MTPDGAFRLLDSFGFDSGAAPSGSVLIAANGSLYGATRSGGQHWGGSLYRLEPDADNDGVRDPIDNCPTMANPTQADADGTAVGDGCPVDGTPKPPARLTLGQLQFTYDGTPKATGVATTPMKAAEPESSRSPTTGRDAAHERRDVLRRRVAGQRQLHDG